MRDDNILSRISKKGGIMLPIIGTLVGGLMKNGLGLLANVVKKKGKEFIEEKTGIKLNDTDDLSEEQLIQLKQFEMEHEEELLRIGIEHEEELIRLELEEKKLDVEKQKNFLIDVQDARNMQKESLKQTDSFAKRFIYYYASAMSLLAFGFIISITFIPIPPPNIRFADTALGFCLATVMASIINFFYGSSQGSKEKSEELKENTSNIIKGGTI